MSFSPSYDMSLNRSVFANCTTKIEGIQKAIFHPADGIISITLERQGDRKWMEMLVNPEEWGKTTNISSLSLLSPILGHSQAVKLSLTIPNLSEDGLSSPSTKSGEISYFSIECKSVGSLLIFWICLIIRSFTYR